MFCIINLVSITACKNISNKRLMSTKYPQPYLYLHHQERNAKIYLGCFAQVERVGRVCNWHCHRLYTSRPSTSHTQNNNHNKNHLFGGWKWAFYFLNFFKRVFHNFFKHFSSSKQFQLRQIYSRGWKYDSVSNWLKFGTVCIEFTLIVLSFRVKNNWYFKITQLNWNF